MEQDKPYGSFFQKLLPHAAARVDAVARSIDDLIAWVGTTFDPFCAYETHARLKHALTIGGVVSSSGLAQTVRKPGGYVTTGSMTSSGS